ncbi:DAK2 domain-containing protein [Mycolicibacterium brumae]|uniref:Dihydroxyacetone kinase n=1 Tax=Mycolicibacterium brumae TaxID=85968 RepID=A0A2G5P9D3_9MYCO|nr:DAK2 domain-containing protein [Mycolicibacterium brumae]MCV7194629.1 DAK2 domain-containing protein [Mycolicibacterium brumae]PIB74962.1 dihydroxyacetone kinase [Mycolicibacterium brumae]RWA17704.1 hypothetical protein MBRU_18615 [Mycolicibacterium brumae DSM 44177]UWW08066.1 DAK2 domain-containing protein [Mycolicibacterium brumae]
MAERQLDGSALRQWAHACVGALITHTDEINRLNVFPVPDGDTGTNMLFTMRAAAAEADRCADGADVVAVAGALAAGALGGARGNSGVILSQILRGLADVTAFAAAKAGGTLDAIDAAVLASGLRHGVAVAVTAMGGELIEGTVVSVLQAAGDAADRGAASGDGLPAVLGAVTDAAAAALDHTPDQLDVLARSGVVDAGGRGLLVLLDQLRATVTGQDASDRPAYEPQVDITCAGMTPEAAERWNAEHAEPVELSPSAPAFEVMYLLSGLSERAVPQLRRRLEDLGDSVSIAAAADGAGEHSVHVHTDDAGAAIEAGLAHGAVSRIRVASLTGPGQAEVAPAGWQRERAVLAVVDGDGAAQLFADEGAVVLRPEHTGDGPFVSAHQLLRAIVDTGAAKVMVLPNGYVAVEELVAGCTAAIGWGIDVVPLPTGSMVAGLAAMAVHDPARRAVDDGYAMAQVAGVTRHGSVRVATEQALTWAGSCRVGDGLGITGDEVMVVRHDLTAAARGLIDLMLGPGGELVTVLLGEGVDPRIGELLAEHVRRYHLAAELVCYVSGHRGDEILIGVE